MLITKRAAKRFIKDAAFSLSKYLARSTEAISVSGVVACALKAARISKSLNPDEIVTLLSRLQRNSFPVANGGLVAFLWNQIFRRLTSLLSEISTGSITNICTIQAGKGSVDSSPV